MSTKLPLALALLLSAAILAVAELRTEVPYYLILSIPAFGGAVVPAAIGNEKCPSAVRLTPELIRGVPIIFSDPQSHGKSVPIDENTEVIIRFNASLHGCEKKTWGNLFYVPPRSTMPIVLLPRLRPLIYQTIFFKVKSVGGYYRVYTQRHGEEGITEYDLDNYHDAENDVRRLAITTKKSNLLFYIHEAKDYYKMIESVI